MNRSDPDTYYEDGKAYENNRDVFDFGRGYIHKGGNEIECGLYGKYVFMESDMSDERGVSYKFEICSVGIFGEKFTRDELLPTTIEVIKDYFPTILKIPNAYLVNSQMGGVDINLRQAKGKQLPFVSMEELVGETIVTIAPSQLTAEADY